MIERYAREAVKKGPRRMHEDLIAIELMEQFGWSWEDYGNTPERIIRLILEKRAIDSKLKP